MTSINKYSNVPLYHQLKDLILEMIESGEYKADSKIPSEQDLCEQYDISRPTVRQAINELTTSGHLYKLKGKGTFVSRSKSLISMKEYNGFTDSVIDSKDPSANNYVSFEVLNAHDMPKLTEIFSLRPDTVNEFAKITFLGTHLDDIISLNTAYLPLALFPDIMDDLRNKRPSHEILKGKYPLLPYHSKSTLDVIYTDQQEAAYLQVQPGQPLIRISNTLYARDGKAVEHVVTKYRADKCRLAFENHK